MPCGRREWFPSYFKIVTHTLLHSTYPVDVIKSRLQTDGLPSQAGTAAKKYNGALDCARKLWVEQGPKGFFRGLTPTLIRWVSLLPFTSRR